MDIRHGLAGVAVVLSVAFFGTFVLASGNTQTYESLSINCAGDWNSSGSPPVCLNLTGDINLTYEPITLENDTEFTTVISLDTEHLPYNSTRYGLVVPTTSWERKSWSSSYSFLERGNVVVFTNAIGKLCPDSVNDCSDITPTPITIDFESIEQNLTIAAYDKENARPGIEFAVFRDPVTFTMYPQNTSIVGPQTYTIEESPFSIFAPLFGERVHEQHSR